MKTIKIIRNSYDTIRYEEHQLVNNFFFFSCHKLYIIASTKLIYMLFNHYQTVIIGYNGLKTISSMI